MTKEMRKKEQRLTMLIIALAITGLILISFLPLITVTEEDSVKEGLYFNYEMMKTSSNAKIKSLADRFSIIDILFWATIILGLISFIFITFCEYLENSRQGQIAMILISFLILFSSIFMVYYEYDFIRTTEGMISLSNIIYQIKYAYIHILFAIFLLICSIRNTMIIVPYSIKQYKSATTGKKVVPKEKPALKTPPSPSIDKKRLEMEKWVTGQIQVLDKQTKSEEKKYPKKETEIPIKPIREEKSKKFEEDAFLEDETRPEQTTNMEDKIIKEPFPERELKEKPKESDDVAASQSFEKALASAIEKEKMKRPEPPEIKKEETKPIETEPEEEAKKVELESTEKSEEITKKKLKIRCPQCKNIFLFEQEGEITKIKCPNCGKEGVIKQ